MDTTNSERAEFATCSGGYPRLGGILGTHHHMVLPLWCRPKFQIQRITRRRALLEFSFAIFKSVAILILTLACTTYTHTPLPCCLLCFHDMRSPRCGTQDMRGHTDHQRLSPGVVHVGNKI